MEEGRTRRTTRTSIVDLGRRNRLDSEVFGRYGRSFVRYTTRITTPAAGARSFERSRGDLSQGRRVGRQQGRVARSIGGFGETSGALRTIANVARFAQTQFK